MAYTARDRAYRRLGLTFAALFTAFLVDGCFGFNLRVPVSAAFFFILLGLLDGVWTAHFSAERSRSRLPSTLWRGVVLALVILNVAFATQVFAAQFLLTDHQ